MQKINIVTSEVEMEGLLNDTDTAAAILEKLPVRGRVNTWGEEIYFEIPVAMEPEQAVEVVEEGELAYWPAGRCFCIFFGKTPASTETEIKPASPVTLVGRLLGDPKEWGAVPDGREITLEII